MSRRHNKSLLLIPAFLSAMVLLSCSNSGSRNGSGNNDRSSTTGATPTDFIAGAATAELDPTFGKGGKVVTDITGDSDQAAAVATQQDGKVVAVGSCVVRQGSSYACLARYNIDGTLDTSFGVGGKVTTDLGGYLAMATTVQADGRIVAAGWCASGSAPEPTFALCLARYQTDGSLDASFGAGGKVTTTIGRCGINDVAAKGDGTLVALVVCAHGGSNSSYISSLARFTATGGVTPSPGPSSGQFELAAGQGHGLYSALAVQSDGKVVVAGVCGTITDLCLARLNPDGTLDRSLGGNGTAKNGFAAGLGAISSVSGLRDGKFLVGGICRSDSPAGGAGPFGICFTRYAGDGGLDRSFAVDGTASTAFDIQDRDQAAYEAVSKQVRAITAQSDGKLIVIGTCGLADKDADFCLTRYRSAQGRPAVPAGPTNFDALWFSRPWGTNNLWPEIGSGAVLLLQRLSPDQAIGLWQIRPSTPAPVGTPVASMEGGMFKVTGRTVTLWCGANSPDPLFARADGLCPNRSGKPTAGIQGTWTGTISADGQTVEGSATVDGRTWSWRAVLRP